jgi:hypothetical protein
MTSDFIPLSLSHFINIHKIYKDFTCDSTPTSPKDLASIEKNLSISS